MKTDDNPSESINHYNVQYKVHSKLTFDCKKVFWQQSTALTSLFVFPQLVDGCHSEWKTRIDIHSNNETRISLTTINGFS